MQVVSADLIRGKKVLLRLDIDVPIENGKVLEEFRLASGLDTLRLCLEHADQVIAMGHIGRPEGKDMSLSVGPVVKWYEKKLSDLHLPVGKFHVLENLRFESGEEAADLDYAIELSKLGDFFINEAFASHHKSASVTVLPTLLPHAAGLRFAKEVETLKKVMENPARPFVAIIGGVKLEDKLPAVLSLAKVADAVLVGGKIAPEVQKQDNLPHNILPGKLSENGLDMAPEAVDGWRGSLMMAKTVLWNGPLGKVEDEENDQSKRIAQMIIESGSESILGGGDSVAALNKWGVLDKFTFVSTGGGAMLKLLIDGTLPSIESLS